jgi:hypothetical protein
MGQMGRLYVYTVALNWFDSNIPYQNLAGDYPMAGVYAVA